MTSVHDSNPEVSIVVPVYNEFDNLPDLVARIDEAMRTQPLSYELIAVDDGSTDGSARRLRELAEQHPMQVRYQAALHSEDLNYTQKFDIKEKAAP
ncbi:glycosyltransferase [Comamonas thiooxydans]|uniref:glycosyltransferase n=1 Tax=Comamonas thiooxydans TaxID=363952 RepID=UPI00325FBF75